jgi:hypothetical protein
MSLAAPGLFFRQDRMSLAGLGLFPDGAQAQGLQYKILERVWAFGCAVANRCRNAVRSAPLGTKFVATAGRCGTALQQLAGFEGVLGCMPSRYKTRFSTV